jgi:methylase of polypeptide subunit release factors
VSSTSVRFGELTVPVVDNVLAPRPWTLAQSDWAVELLDTTGEGPLLELFAGSGHIGIEAARRAGRRVVLVDASPDACDVATVTAAAFNVDAEVRCATVCADEVERVRPALIMADPPYVPSDDTSSFSNDPAAAIDGGPDGLEPARITLLAVQRTACTGVPVLIQLRGLQQVARLDHWLATQELGLAVSEVRCAAADRALALILPGIDPGAT